MRKQVRGACCLSCAAPAACSRSHARLCAAAALCHCARCAAAFTTVTRHTYNPVFADTRAFPIVPTVSALNVLRNHPLHFVVCDDAQAVNPSDNPAAAPAPSLHASKDGGAGHRAVLGVATVSLAQIAEGIDVDGAFDVVDERGTAVGKLNVRCVRTPRSSHTACAHAVLTHSYA